MEIAFQSLLDLLALLTNQGIAHLNCRWWRLCVRFCSETSTQTYVHAFTDNKAWYKALYNIFVPSLPLKRAPHSRLCPHLSLFFFFPKTEKLSSCWKTLMLHSWQSWRQAWNVSGTPALMWEVADAVHSCVCACVCVCVGGGGDPALHHQWKVSAWLVAGVTLNSIHVTTYSMYIY